MRIDTPAPPLSARLARALRGRVPGHARRPAAERAADDRHRVRGASMPGCRPTCARQPALAPASPRRTHDLQSMAVCDQSKLRMTTRDGLIGGAVMIIGATAGVLLAIAARRAGWMVTAEILLNFAFFVVAHAVDAVLADEGPALEGANRDRRLDAPAAGRDHPGRDDALTRVTARPGGCTSSAARAGVVRQRLRLCGRRRPVIVSAATSALTIASSVACTVAVNSALIRAFDSIVHGGGLVRAAAPAFAVENAMKMSPEPLPDVAPVRAEPERRAAGEALELVRQQRRVGGDDDDDRARLQRRRRARRRGAVGDRAAPRRRARRRSAVPAAPWLACTSTPTV